MWRAGAHYGYDLGGGGYTVIFSQSCAVCMEKRYSHLDARLLLLAARLQLSGARCVVLCLRRGGAGGVPRLCRPPLGLQGIGPERHQPLLKLLPNHKVSNQPPTTLQSGASAAMQDLPNPGCCHGHW